MRRVACLTLLLVLSLPAWLNLTGTAFAQDAPVVDAHARYAVMPAHLRNDLALVPAGSLQSWNGSFTFGGTNYSYNMVGAAPSTDSTATITTYIIPVKI